ADKLAKVVLAQAARGMVEHRDRFLSTYAMAVAGLQAKLRTAKGDYSHIAQFVEAEFAKEYEQNPELKRVLTEILEQIPEAQKVLQKAEGGGYKPLAWKGVLERVTDEVLAKLLPEDRAAGAQFAGRLRLHADPEFVADKLAAAVRPWQTSLQQK